LGISSVVMLVKPVTLPLGRARLATSPIPIGSPTAMKMIGIVEVAAFRGERRRGAVDRYDHVDLAGDEVSRQCR
jgi:hypothetical protein